MTNNVEGLIKKHDEGGGLKMTQNSMTSFMDGPLSSLVPFFFYHKFL